MKHLALALALAFIALPCMAKKKPPADYYHPPHAGFVGHKDCRAYFAFWSRLTVYLPDPPLAELARMTDAEKEAWRARSVMHSAAHDLSPEEEKWWAEGDYKKFRGLCYIPFRYLSDPQSATLPTFSIHLTKSHSSKSERQIASDTSSSDVDVRSRETGAVIGRAEVETTTSYPVNRIIDYDFVDAEVVRFSDVDASPVRVFTTHKSRRQGDLGWVGTVELFRHAPRENAFHECLKFLMLETGLKKK